MIEKPDRKIILEDGEEYLGSGFGATTDRVLEIVFNTSMVGYQEILSDPSYTDQAVVMTYPLIGNYGMAADDYETATPTIGALVVREYNDEPSNFRAEKTLGEVMREYGIPGIAGVDTRKLNRSIRDHGSRKAILCSANVPLDEGLRILRETALPKNAVSRVSCRAPYEVGEPGSRFHVVAVDCGMKLNIVRSLVRRGCRVTVVPWNTTAGAILSLSPDGVFLSNGPGDPEDAEQTIETARALIGEYPVFGICLGHQIIALALGAKTYRLKFGHRGGNHPVCETKTGRIEITSQNHSYAVDIRSLAGTGLEVTRVNLLDGTVEGLACEDKKVFSVQYHPESSPGPQDSAELFDRFLENARQGVSE